MSDVVEQQFISSLLTKPLKRTFKYAEKANSSWFKVYDKEFEYLMEFYKKYSRFPDKDTFLTRFPSFGVSDVKEPMKYYVTSLQGSHIFEIAKRGVSQINLQVSQGNTDGYSLARSIREVASNLEVQTDTEAAVYAADGDRFSRYRERSDPTGSFFVPPFGTLKYAINRLIPGNIMTLFARPSVGKTWVGCMFALHAALEQGLRVGILSPEMTEPEIIDRMDAIYCKLSWTKFQRGTLSARELVLWKNGVKKLKKSLKDRLLVLDKEMLTTGVDEIRATVADNTLDMIVVDAFHQLNAPGSSEVEKVYYRMRSMKQMAKAHNLMVILTTQQKRTGGRNKIPTGEKIAWGDAYEQESDVVLNMTGDPKSSVRKMELCKVRNGALRDFEIVFRMDPKVCIEERVTGSTYFDVPEF